MIVIGDSQAEGVLPTLRSSGFATAGSEANRGWSSTRLIERVRPGAPVVFMAGGNDTPNAGYVDRVRSIAARLPAGSVWVGPVAALVTPDATTHERVANLQRQALSGEQVPGVRWVDARPLTRDLANNQNVHLTRLNYVRFARRLEQKLKSGGFGAGTLVLGLLAAYVTARWLSS